MTGRTRDDLYVCLGNIQRGHLRDIDMTGGTPDIMIVRFARAVSGESVSIVPELKRESLW